MGVMLVLFGVRVLRLGKPYLLMDLKHKSTSLTWLLRCPWMQPVSPAT